MHDIKKEMPLSITSAGFRRKIIEAIKNETLVVFAGAGVSTEKPTSLPSFYKLAKNIAHLCGRVYDKSEKEEVFFGRLEREGINVKQMIAEQLSGNNLLPNDWHHTILRLFRNKRAIKIVTTNQDVMFEAAAKHEKMGSKIYSTPIIPPGKEFTGIIHLHGSVSEPDKMIMTDRDFGEAYMLQGHATRFIVELLQNNTVLFIGYSYDDVILRYLTTSIPSETFQGAYILTEDDHVQMIDNTGLAIITFPQGKFTLEKKEIKSICDLAGWELSDWKRFFSKHRLQPPTDTRSRDDILLAITDPDIRGQLLSITQGEPWLHFLNENGFLDVLFDESSQMEDVDYTLGFWINKQFLKSALPHLMLIRKQTPRKEYAISIMSYIEQHIQHNRASLYQKYFAILWDVISLDKVYLIHFLETTKGFGLYHEMWKCFCKICSYRITLNKGFSLSHEIQTIEYHYVWCIHEELFEASWKNHVSQYIQLFSHQALMLGVDVLCHLSADLKKSCGKHDSHVPIDMTPLESEDHTGMIEHKPIQVISNMIEVSFIEITKSDMNYAQAWLMQYINTNCILLKRLLLMLMRKYLTLPAEEILEVLYNHYDIHDIKQRDQVYKMVANLYDELSPSCRRMLLKKICTVRRPARKKISQEEIDRYKTQKVYDWLTWLQLKCKNTDDINDLLSDIQSRYPFLRPKEHPCLVIGPSIVNYGSESPVSEEELHDMAPAEAYRFIKLFREDRFSLGPDRYGLLHTLTNVSASDNRWAIGFLEELVIRRNQANDLWERLFYGLEVSVNSKYSLSNVLRKLTTETVYNHAICIAQFLCAVLEKDSVRDSISKSFQKRLVSFLRRMWLHKKETRVDSEETMVNALNSTTGALARLQLKLLCLDEQRNTGIPAWFSALFSSVSASEIEYVCIICSHFRILFHFDEIWTSEHVLPLLSTTNHNSFEAAWEGFLTTAASIDKKMGNKLLPLFQQSLSRCMQLRPVLVRKYVECYALLLLYISDHPLEEHTGYLIGVCREKDRQHFAFTIGRILKSMKPSDAERVWRKWLKRFWELRNMNVPKKMDSGEYIEMICWIVPLNKYFDDIIKLATAVNISIKKMHHILYDQRWVSLLKDHPKSARKLLLHLQTHAESKIDKNEIQEILDGISQ